PDWLGEQVRRLILGMIGFLLKVIAGLQEKGGREHSRAEAAGVATRASSGAAATCWSPASAGTTGTHTAAGARGRAARGAPSRLHTAGFANRSGGAAAATCRIPACAGMTGKFQLTRVLAPVVTRRASGQCGTIHCVFQKGDFGAPPSHVLNVSIS